MNYYESLLERELEVECEACGAAQTVWTGEAAECAECGAVDQLEIVEDGRPGD